jgi:hypothetical protein
MKTSTKFIIAVLILLALAGGVYWYIFFYGPGNGTPTVNNTNNGTTGGFVPLNAPNNNTNQTTNNSTNNNNNTNSDNNQNSSSTPVITEKVPALRLLSANPIGGYGASTTASTTVVRWVDRGRGNIMEARGDTEEIFTLSNTILPRVYISIWNKNLTAFIGSLLSSNSDIPTVVYAKLNVQASSTQPKDTSTTTADTEPTKVTPYFLRGKNLPQNMITYAVSPKGDKLFMLIKESGQGAGYISNFDGTSVTKIFIQPLTQVSVEWPEENTIAITTNGSASQAGFLYFINPKTGIWKKIIGPVFGISTKVSRDAKYVLVSGSTNSQNIMTNIYPIGTTTPIDAVVKTLADKCTWGNYYKELVYCATPSQPISGIYPDDWYKGVVTSYDKIWQINVKNNDIRQVSSLLGQANKLINAFNMSTDSRDDFLFFMNKDDLSLWSLDLNSR